MTDTKLKVLVVGLGQMGRSHALAYHTHPGFEIVGLVNRSTPTLPAELTGYPIRNDFAAALAEFKPDVVAIATHTNTHADYAVAALESGAHVFVEKPLAATA
jgi:predicted dehydrogenase